MNENELLEPLNEEECDFVSTLSNLEIQNNASKTRIRRNWLDVLETLLRDHKKIHHPKIPISDDKEALVIVISDNHFGKIRHSLKPPYKEVFNLKIADKRMSQLFDEAIEEISHNPAAYDQVKICMLGDHIEGDGSTYPTQGFLTDDIVHAQTAAFITSLNKNIKKLNDFFIETYDKLLPVDFHWVPGNHGTPKSKLSRHPDDNWDKGVAKAWETTIRSLQLHDPNIMKNVTNEYKTNLGDSQSININIKGWNFHLRHIMKKSAGTPSSDREAFVLHGIHNADVVLTGHYHYQLIVEVGKTTIVRSSSMCGYDDFADTIAAPYSQASQMILSVSKERKIKKIITVYFKD